MTSLSNALIRKGEVCFFQSEELLKNGFVNAFSTRKGGVSPLPQKALNLDFRDDSGENVRKNRELFLRGVGRESWPIVTMQQTHSDRFCYLSTRQPLPAGEPPADALISDKPGVFLAVKTADCLPLLIGDSQSGLMLAIHSGWRGLLSRVTEKAITHVVSAFRVETASWKAAIGPHACGRCYEISGDLGQKLRDEGYKDFEILRKTSTGKFLLDMDKANRQLLERCGLLGENIHSVSACTMHQNDLFFSHRREGGEDGHREPVGRLLAIIGRPLSGR